MAYLGPRPRVDTWAFLGRSEDTAPFPHAIASKARRPIAATKLSAPPLRPGIVDRPVLIDSLASATSAPVVLVSAAAGYGKTTVLALWRERDERPFAWVTLEASDNDPVALVGSVVAAIDPLVRLDSLLADALCDPEPALEEFVLPTLISHCVDSHRSFVLVLDDLHLVTERRCHAAINYIAERLPAGCQLALATRTDPPLPLAKWRAHGQLMELRAAELSLDHAEARAVLAAAQVHLSDDLIAKLVERTEGWPAALYLAALSLRDRSNPEGFVDRFAGTSRHVADFLSEDVLARQPEDVIAFLLRTCVLEELTPSLCNELTGGMDADVKLQELERSNLFVVPLDEERLSYRYHHLFAQYLRAELARRSPELVPELHRRARELRPNDAHAHVSRALSHAEQRVLRLLASDLSLSEIGRELFLSANTVRTHKRAIYRKLGVTSRLDAVKAAQINQRDLQSDSPG